MAAQNYFRLSIIQNRWKLGTGAIGDSLMKNFVVRKHKCEYFDSILSGFLEEYASEYVKENPTRMQRKRHICF